MGESADTVGLRIPGGGTALGLVPNLVESLHRTGESWRASREQRRKRAQICALMCARGLTFPVQESADLGLTSSTTTLEIKNFTFATAIGMLMCTLLSVSVSVLSSHPLSSSPTPYLDLLHRVVGVESECQTCEVEVLRRSEGGMCEE